MFYLFAYNKIFSVIFFIPMFSTCSFCVTFLKDLLLYNSKDNTDLSYSCNTVLVRNEDLCVKCNTYIMGQDLAPHLFPLTCISLVKYTFISDVPSRIYAMSVLSEFCLIHPLHSWHAFPKHSLLCHILVGMLLTFTLHRPTRMQ